MITAAGVYPDISIDQYHRDIHLCDGPSISSSGLRTIITESPAHYWAFSPYNQNRFPSKATKAIDIGRASHSWVLGEPAFYAYFTVSPYDKFTTKEARAWRDSEPRTILTADEFELVKAMAAVQKSSPQVMRAFEDGAPEVSLLWRDKTTGIWLRSRPDWFPNNPAARFITEYKSCRSIEPSDFSRDVFDEYGYEIQVAMMVDGVREVLGIEPVGVCLVCQEKTPPYLVELRMFTEDQIEDGRALYHHALGIFAQCLKSGQWPGYTDGPTYFDSPYKHLRTMEALRDGTGRFAPARDTAAANEAAGD